MNPYETTLAELEAEHSRKRDELRRQYDVLSVLPTGYNWRVHMIPLYDRMGSIHLDYERYESIRKGPDPTLDTVVELWNMFPSEDIALYRDGTVGIRTLQDAIKELEKAEARNENTSATLRPLCPFWISVDPTPYTNGVRFHWITTVAGYRMEFRIGFASYSAAIARLGSCDIRYQGGDWQHRDRDERVVTQNYFNATPAVQVIGNAKLDKVTYGSGSRTTPGQHLLFWDSANGEPGTATLPDLIAILKGDA